MLSLLLVSAVSFSAIAGDEARDPAKDAGKAAPSAAPAAKPATSGTALTPIDKLDRTDKPYAGEAAVLRTTMNELFDASRRINGVEKVQAREKIETSLDWDRIARECIGAANWKKQSEKNRTDFRNLLKEVVVKTAYTRLDKFWDNASFKYEKIDVKGNEAHVTAKFTVNGDTFPLDYYLGKKGPRWFIHDIAFEDIRYSTNIFEQISAFLKEKPFSELLASLRKRRDELVTQNAKDANG